MLCFSYIVKFIVKRMTILKYVYFLKPARYVSSKLVQEVRQLQFFL